ncbi:MAG: hypothetical protein J7641_06455 [Cyanobacteria bacterium SID2]|nr:hypothetical protein [Cyanobacteria bacterium SID2]MBP0003371.1 hypothetical protein [Cyanobacteria bacterium SBC]
MFDRVATLTSAFVALLSSVTLTTAGRAESVSVATRLATSSIEIADGKHLYGSAPQPQQLGEMYMVFEARGNQVVGGFYQPNSSFDCFQGSIDGDRLALNVTDSYRNDTYTYDIALDSQAAVVANTQAGTPMTSLQGFHPIETLSEIDRQVLETCQAAIRG